MEENSFVNMNGNRTVILDRVTALRRNYRFQDAYNLLSPHMSEAIRNRDKGVLMTQVITLNKLNRNQEAFDLLEPLPH